MSAPTEAERIAAKISARQRNAIQWLSPGGYVVGFRPEWAGLKQRGFDELKRLGLIDEVWTWASTTRPDTGLSPLGLAVRAILEREA